MSRLQILDRGRVLHLALILPVCACTPRYTGTSDVYDQPWSHGLVTGFIGITDLKDADYDVRDPSIELEDDEPSTLPMIGGLVQYPLAGQRLQIGVEGGATAGWDGDTGTIILDNGTVIRSYDNDLFLFDVFGGLYVNAFLSRRMRFYVGAGPMIQYADVDLDYKDPIDEDDQLSEDGLGLGVYARTGIELQFRPGSYVGLGVRWIDTTVDMGGAFNDLDVKGLQFGLTVTAEL